MLQPSFAIKFDSEFKKSELKLNEYIRDILLFKEKVVIPGLGSIMVERTPARIKGKKLLPPSVNVAFDPVLKTDDGVLAARLSEGEGLELEEARQRVLEYTDEILFSLNKGEAFHIESLGTLSLDESSSILFSPDSSLDLNFDSFGLESFELDPVEETSDDSLSSESVKETPVIKEKETVPEPGVPEAVIMEEKSPETQEPASPKGNRNTVWVLTGATVVILASLVIIGLTTDIFSGTFSLKSLMQPQNDELIIDDNFPDTGDDEEFEALLKSLEEEIDSSTDASEALNPVVEENPSIQAAPSTARYHIIAGSFKDMKNAAEMQQMLTMEGLQSIVVEKGDGIYRVSAAAYNDKETALRELSRFRARKGMSGAWVLSLE